MILTEFDSQRLGTAVKQAKLSFEQYGRYPMGAVLSVGGEIKGSETNQTDEFPIFVCAEHRNWPSYASTRLLVQNGLPPNPAEIHDGRKRDPIVLYTSLFPDDIGVCVDAGVSRIVCASACPYPSIKDFLDELDRGEDTSKIPSLEECFVPEAADLFIAFLDRYRSAKRELLDKRDLLYFDWFPKFLKKYSDPEAKQEIRGDWELDLARAEFNDGLGALAYQAAEKGDKSVKLSDDQKFLPGFLAIFDESFLPSFSRLYNEAIKNVRDNGEIVIENGSVRMDDKGRLILVINQKYIEKMGARSAHHPQKQRAIWV
ncbi:hypothetical protein HYU14_01805 [Candidatus Woesearchaeota archaeon]|nr:hypothetical protein [Candidatus Woesearchaeota archaeon]